MTTHFITVEIALKQSTIELNQAISAEISAKQIEAELQKLGEPLRWAITRVNPAEQTVQVEAVVTRA